MTKNRVRQSFNSGSSPRKFPHLHYTVELYDEVLFPRRTLEVSGRPAWALLELHRAGYQGCSAVSHPAPRWPAYVHELRRMGVQIHQRLVDLDGAFPTRVAIYTLLDVALPYGGTLPAWLEAELSLDFSNKPIWLQRVKTRAVDRSGKRSA